MNSIMKNNKSSKKVGKIPTTELLRELDTSITYMNGDPVDWNDADILNNPEKLMQMNFDEPLLQVARSPTFVESVTYKTEMLLQDGPFNELVKAYKKARKESGDKKTLAAKPSAPETCTKQFMMEKSQESAEQIAAWCMRIKKYQEEFLQMYIDCKNKPFWDNREVNGEAMLSEKQKNKVLDWIKILETFNTTYGQVEKLRRSRQSMFGNLSEEKHLDMDKLLDQLKKLNERLADASKIFEELQ